MSGSLYLYISNEGEVYKIPKPYYSDFKAVPSLANKEILLVFLSYKTLNRKLLELEFVSFHRDTLNKNGELIINVIGFPTNFETAESLAESEDLIPLPTAPQNIPTAKEKDALYSYIKGNYATLWPSCSYLVEQHIKSLEEIFRKNIDFVKQVYKIQNNKY